jgi:steroid delta-isomerase-like uncharacterized protein
LTPEELEATARRFFELVYDRRDLTLASELLAEAFVDHLPPPSRLLNGPAGPTAHFQALLDASDDLRVEILDVVTDGQRVGVRARYFGTDTAAIYPGMPARGRRFDVEGIDVFVIDDSGKFAEHIGIVDMRAAMDQLGVSSSAWV